MSFYLQVFSKSERLRNISITLSIPSLSKSEMLFATYTPVPSTDIHHWKSGFPEGTFINKFYPITRSFLAPFWTILPTIAQLTLMDVPWGIFHSLLQYQKSDNLQYNMVGCWDECSKHYFFFHNFLQNSLQKSFQFIFL